MAVKNATFKPLLVPTKRETKYITIVETTKPITKIKTEEAEYTTAIELINSLFLIYYTKIAKNRISGPIKFEINQLIHFLVGFRHVYHDTNWAR